MSNVIRLPRRPNWDVPLSKRRFALLVGFSTRWVELRVREGMPVTRLPNGHTRYLPSECFVWLRENGYDVDEHGRVSLPTDKDGLPTRRVVPQPSSAPPPPPTPTPDPTPDDELPDEPPDQSA